MNKRYLRYSLAMRFNFVQRPLFQALCVSLLLHLLLGFGLGWPLPIKPTLSSGAFSVVVSARVEAPVAAGAAEQAGRAVSPKGGTREARRPDMPRQLVVADGARPLGLSEAQPVQTVVQENAGGVAAGSSSAPRVETGEAVSADALRQYRISLASSARRFRHYPAAARARGLEGVAEISILVSPALQQPAVRLGRSSGHALLDEQALAMLEQAVRATPVPEGLRSREIIVPLPIRFSLEGD